MARESQGNPYCQYALIMISGDNCNYTHTNDIIATCIRGSLNKFPDFFHMGTFIDSTHMKL